MIRFESGSADIRVKENGKTKDGEAMMVNNENTIRGLVDDVSKLLQKGQGVRIVLAGHTDKVDFGNVSQSVSGRSGSGGSARFKSNFELSDARALAAHLYLRRKFGKSIEEWALFPLADGDSLWGGKPPVEEEDRRSVEVWVESVESPESRAWRRGSECSANTRLNDYLYFAIYTVTTTGFGDIRPVSAKAKFMTSACNLYELFFVVVFFNVLIASRRHHDPEYGLLRTEIRELRKFLESPSGPLN